MVNLKLKYYSDGKEITTNELTIYNRINFIVGDSGCGKSLFLNNLYNSERGSLQWKVECNKDIVIIDSINDQLFIEMLKNSSEKLFIIDEDEMEYVRRHNLLYSILMSKNYFIIITRENTIYMDTNINAVYKLVDDTPLGSKVRVSKFKSAFGIEKTTCKDFLNARKIISEDSESGAIFYKKVLKQLELVEFDNTGNGSIKENIERLLRMNNEDIIVALDYDFGAMAIQSILDSKEIDTNRIYLIPMESFEEIICNSEFILSKFPEMRDKVINYKKYINAQFKSTGHYFSTLLFKYVKVKSPVKEKSSRNVTKFYEKGMKNFEECFIDNCCSYEIDKHCKLYYDKDKKVALLSNKFEFL